MLDGGWENLIHSNKFKYIDAYMLGGKNKAGCVCSEKDQETKSEKGCSCNGKGAGCDEERALRVVTAPRIYRERRPVKGEVVTVIDVKFSSSGIDLSEAWSRAVPRGDVHEIMLWNPLGEGEDAAAVAFIEITQGGNIVNGDEVRVDGEPIGNLTGFDYNHMPNHMNMVVEVNNLDPKLKLGSIFEFVPNPMLSIIGDGDCC